MSVCSAKKLAAQKDIEEGGGGGGGVLSLVCAERSYNRSSQSQREKKWIVKGRIQK